MPKAAGARISPRWLLAALTVLPLLASCRRLGGETVQQPVAPPQASPAPGAESAAYSRFEQEVAAYMALRREATRGVPALKPRVEAATIAAHQRAQAEAIRARRLGVKAGDIFTPEVAPVIGRVVKEELSKIAEERRKVTRENPRSETPSTPVAVRVNADYPVEASVSTVPPVLLRLPKLPEGLEYRFVGRHLVLRDVDANMIVDYLLDVVP